MKGFNMKKFYIAFSIHGTNVFITAVVETDDYFYNEEKNTYQVLGDKYAILESRRPDYNVKTDGIKLGARGLNSVYKNIPLRCPRRIMKFFNHLEKAGWTVNKDAFKEKFFPKKN